MKKVLFLAVLLLMSVAPTLNASAQEDNASQPRQRSQYSGRGAQQRMDPAKMLENRVNQMAKKYNLDDKQKEKIMALYKEQMTPKKKDGEQNRMDFRNMTEEQREAMKKEREERTAQFDAKIKKILTDEQYQQYKEDQKNRQNRGFGNNGNGRNRSMGNDNANGQKRQRPERPQKSIKAENMIRN